MAVLAAAQEVESFVATGTVAVSSQGGTFQGDTARSSLLPSAQNDFFEFTWVAGETDIWIHWDQILSGTSGNVNPGISWHNSSGTEFVRLDVTGEELQIWNGSDFTTITIDLTGLLPNGTLVTLDVHIIVAVAGEVTIYVDGLPNGGFNQFLDTSSWADISKFRNFGTQLFDVFYVSAVIVADEKTVNWRLATLFADGNGFHTDFVGDFTDIDQLGYSDGDFISSDTPGDIESFTGSNIDGGLSGLFVRAIAVGIRSRKQNGGDAVIQAMVRTGGADFFGDSETIIDDGSWHSDNHVFNGNPAGGDWDFATANAINFGVKHVS